MSILEDAKKIAERATGYGRPRPQDLLDAVRDRAPHRYRFRQSGLVPNHPRWPLIHYRSAARLGAGIDPAALFEDLFARNGWGGSWRDGVYDYLHYHSRTRGHAVVQFGGKSGRRLRVKAGDVVILPAGTGHELISASKDFLVVGAYPASGNYDLRKPTENALCKALTTVPRVPPPRKDPVYGKGGKLLALWKKARKKTKTRKRKAA